MIDASVGPLESVRARYLGFAEHQAKGVSPRYERLARAVAGSEEMLTFVSGLEGAHQQPNLVLASVRWVCGVPDDGDDLAQKLRDHGPRIRSTIESRRTQTNEAGRCATLLPVLAGLPEPLALLEVGASAGLCLLPDRYGYDFGEQRIAPPTVDAPILGCQVPEGTEVPTRVPAVVWRRGLDLSPIDVDDPDQTAWLENLVWPELETRAHRLAAALDVARRDRPVVETGDLLQDLERVAAGAPSDATLVVFHSAVLAYLDAAGRASFRERVSALDAVWVSNEGLSVFPDISERLGSRARPDRFIVSVDGDPVALAGPHGQTFEWL